MAASGWLSDRDMCAWRSAARLSGERPPGRSMVARPSVTPLHCFTFKALCTRCHMRHCDIRFPVRLIVHLINVNDLLGPRPMRTKTADDVQGCGCWGVYTLALRHR